MNKDIRVLFILADFNLYGGTPRKTLTLLEGFGHNSFLYIYSDDFLEFENEFKSVCSSVNYASRDSSFFKHLRNILAIIDLNNIQIVPFIFLKRNLP